MGPGNIFFGLGPLARVSTAVLPFAVAIFMRFVLGNNQLTRGLLSFAVLWFAANILMAPYSEHVRQDISNLRTLLP